MNFHQRGLHRARSSRSAIARRIFPAALTITTVLLHDGIAAAQRPAPQSTTPPSAVQDRSSAAADTRVPVEDRSSSESRLAKGDINFDDLKFDIQKGQAFQNTQLNDRVKSLDQKKVKLRGYILPSTLFKETDIEQFVLVRDNQECCFGPGAALYDCVIVQMVPGRTTDFVTRPVTVEGTFKIDPESYKYPEGASPDGSSHMAVFHIDGVSVR